MLYENEKHTNGHKPSQLKDCYLDFMLSRPAMLCTPGTMKFYRDTLGKFLEWLEGQEIIEPEQINAKYVRAFLATFAERGCRDSYIHTYARSARTFIRFLFAEGYIPEPVVFQMPKIGEKRLPILSIQEVQEVIHACQEKRDKAVIMLMVDTGLRRSETCNMDWGDVDLASGLCLVRNGKGKKDRSVVIGVKTRRVILRYKQEVANDDCDPLFQTRSGNRLSPLGLRSLLVRISKRTGIRVSPHTLRRTFVVMALKGGMSIAHVQAIMGHRTPIMTLEYVKLVDDDLLDAHREHGPVDNFLKA
jgi:site-specific recombinase XerD